MPPTRGMCITSRSAGVAGFVLIFGVWNMHLRTEGVAAWCEGAPWNGKTVECESLSGLGEEGRGEHWWGMPLDTRNAGGNLMEPPTWGFGTMLGSLAPWLLGFIPAGETTPFLKRVFCPALGNVLFHRCHF